MGDKKVEVQLGNNTKIYGDFVVANSIKDSFNKANKAKVPDELKNILEELTVAIGKMNEILSKDDGKRVARSLETLIDEATSDSPQRQWWSVSIDGLTQAAEKVGKIGKPVLSLIAQLVPILEQISK